MPRCICTKVDLPSFADRPPMKHDSDTIQGEYVVHKACRFCGGFNIFIWGSDGKIKGQATHEAFLQKSRAYNTELKKELESRLKLKIEDYNQAKERLNDCDDLSSDCSELYRYIERNNKHIESLLAQIRTCSGQIN